MTRNFNWRTSRKEKKIAEGEGEVSDSSARLRTCERQWAAAQDEDDEMPTAYDFSHLSRLPALKPEEQQGYTQPGEQPRYNKAAAS